MGRKEKFHVLPDGPTEVHGLSGENPFTINSGFTPVRLLKGGTGDDSKAIFDGDMKKGSLLLVISDATR